MDTSPVQRFLGRRNKTDLPIDQNRLVNNQNTSTTEWGVAAAIPYHRDDRRVSWTKTAYDNGTKDLSLNSNIFK